MENHEIISLPETIIMVILSLISEVLDIIDLGWIIGFPLQFWIFLKGGDFNFKKQGVSIVGNLIELIPFIDWLPIRTITLIITINRINYPENFGITNVTSTAKKANPVKGGK